MLIPVIRTKLFYSGELGEAPAGSETIFDMAKNHEFLSRYGYRPGQNWPEYAEELIRRWNALGAPNWKYTLASEGYYMDTEG